MKKLLSAIQPSNQLTLGNYFGAIKQYVALQHQYESYIFIADLHAITNPKVDYSTLKQNKINAVCLYTACGIDLKLNHVFYQSDVPSHTELAHILMCHTYMGELSRMTQYKDKMQKFTNANGTETIPAGLFTYPVLMASDILLYDAEVVPVGSDQKQHLELTKTLALRFNKKYGNTFVVPNPLIAKFGSKIMDLANPEIKMSKSNTNEKGTIFLLEDIEITRKKIMSAKTDSLNKVKFDQLNQPGVSNLMTIYHLLTQISMEEIESKYANQNYGVFKKDLADLVCNHLGNIQAKYHECLKEYETKIKPILIANTKIVNEITNKKLQEIYKKIGMK
ncbi:MAG: tryptophan--tRNA ligase [Candidatus Malacoplasma girerdii]|nr:MAG: tryptophan--tRNA ligase [Candidatus Malacoplasma girerdii]